jgi:hypothetical protein
MEQPAGGSATDLPLLRFLAEEDDRRPDDMERPKRTQVDCIGVEAVNPAAGMEAEGDAVVAHG